MVLTQLGETLVERVGDHVVIECGGPQGVVEESFQLKRCAHAPEFEVAKPQLPMGELGELPGAVEPDFRTLSHESVTWPGEGGTGGARRVESTMSLACARSGLSVSIEDRRKIA